MIDPSDASTKRGFAFAQLERDLDTALRLGERIESRAQGLVATIGVLLTATTIAVSVNESISLDIRDRSLEWLPWAVVVLWTLALLLATASAVPRKVDFATPTFLQEMAQAVDSRQSFGEEVRRSTAWKQVSKEMDTIRLHQYDRIVRGLRVRGLALAASFWLNAVALVLIAYLANKLA